MGRHFLVTGETEVERVLRYSFLVFVKEKKKIIFPVKAIPNKTGCHLCFCKIIVKGSSDFSETRGQACRVIHHLSTDWAWRDLLWFQEMKATQGRWNSEVNTISLKEGNMVSSALSTELFWDIGRQWRNTDNIRHEKQPPLEEQKDSVRMRLHLPISNHHWKDKEPISGNLLQMFSW